MNYFILIVSIFLTGIIVYSILNFYELFAIYNCITTDFFWKLENNKLSSCFRSKPNECSQIDPYGIYGFCNDLDYYGVGIGENKGPYGYYCDDWVFDSKNCSPETCELANSSKRFGWCVDTNRAYLGSSCGPNDKYGIQCKQWIWNSPEKCPRGCPKIIKKPKLTKKIPKCPIKKKDDPCIC
jgi:hypothetical protein